MSRYYTNHPGLAHPQAGDNQVARQEVEQPLRLKSNSRAQARRGKLPRSR